MKRRRTVAEEREAMRLRCEEVVAERFYAERRFCHDPRDYEVVRAEVRACVDAIRDLRAGRPGGIGKREVKP